MKRAFKLFGLLALSVLITASGASAHDFWVAAEFSDGLLKADIGYGHDFPNPEPIAEDRTQLFEPLKLITPEGATEMAQTGSDNFHYEVKAELKKGDYLVCGDYKPTFWANGPEGWRQADRSKYKELTKVDATRVQESAMLAKLILNVDGADSTNVITKPVGQRLEIVPQVNPATVKPGGRFPVKVLLDGEPVKTTDVRAVYAGFGSPFREKDPAKNYQAFVGRTDLEGIVEIIPLKAGFWNAYVKVSIPYADKAVADETSLTARLTFTISD
ncbi:MAG: DUF4198 domain-containing protein [Fretibacterium sp.]|nr:DUF4198 domain-containing protein [Fretibacterium sp.]